MQFINFLKSFYKGEASLPNAYFFVGWGLTGVVLIIFFTIMSVSESLISGIYILEQIFLKFYLILSIWLLFIAMGFFRTIKNIGKNENQEDSGKSDKSFKVFLLQTVFFLSSLKFVFFAFYSARVAFYF